MTRSEIIATLPALQRQAWANHQAECKSFINRDRIELEILVQYSDGSSEVISRG